MRAGEATRSAKGADAATGVGQAEYEVECEHVLVDRAGLDR
jgi:hypothetical protein